MLNRRNVIAAGAALLLLLVAWGAIRLGQYLSVPAAKPVENVADAWRAIKVGRNYGENVELLDGVAATDQLVLNPPDSMATGDRVTIAPQQAPASEKNAKAAK